MSDSTTEAADSKSFVFYHYTPSMALAVISVFLFLATSVWHIYKVATKRTWYFIPFIIGCLFEAVGYAGRALSSQQAPDFSMGPYVMQSLLLLLGPTLMAASIYMVLGRLVIVLHGDDLVLIRPKWLTKVFVLGDVLSFFAQSGGGGMLAQAKTESAVNMGNNIIIGGLGIQILFFAFFIVVIVLFHMRIHQYPTSQSQRLQTPWRTLMYILYFSSTLIMIRSAFRIIEYIMGQDSELMASEKYLYILDAIPMAATAVSFSVFHPSRVVSREAIREVQIKHEVALEELGTEYVPLHDKR